MLAGAAAGPRRRTPDRPAPGGGSTLELGRLHLVTLAGPAGRVEQTTTLTPAQRELFAATGIAPPPRVTSLQPGLNPVRSPLPAWAHAAQAHDHCSPSSAPQFPRSCAHQLRNSGVTIADALRIYCARLAPGTRVVTRPLWLMTVLDRTVLRGQLRGTLELMRVLQHSGERGVPARPTAPGGTDDNPPPVVPAAAQRNFLSCTVGKVASRATRSGSRHATQVVVGGIRWAGRWWLADSPNERSLPRPTGKE